MALGGTQMVLYLSIPSYRAVQRNKAKTKPIRGSVTNDALAEVEKKEIAEKYKNAVTMAGAVQVNEILIVHQWATATGRL
jgi:hypothetical protein